MPQKETNTRETDLLKNEPWLIPGRGLEDLEEFLTRNHIDYTLETVEDAVKKGMLPKEYLQKHVMTTWGCEDSTKFPNSDPMPFAVFTKLHANELRNRFYEWYQSDEYWAWVDECMKKAAEEHNKDVAVYGKYI